MKNKFILSLVIFFTLAGISMAQSVKVSPKKVIYTRTAFKDQEYKKYIHVTYPVIGPGTSTKVRRKISSQLDYESVFEESIKEAVAGSLYLERYGYKIKYNKNRILDIQLMMDGSGAYPWTTEREFLFDLKSGRKITAADVFNRYALNKLSSKVRAMLNAEVRRTKRKIGSDSIYFRRTDYSDANLNYMSISDKGIAFNYDYEFPFVVLSLKPVGKFFFSWRELKPYIKPAGLFGQFVK